MSELSYLEKLLDGAEVEWLTAAEIFNIKMAIRHLKLKILGRWEYPLV